MKIVIGCDHAALTLKDAVKAHLLELGHEVKDFGIYQAGEKCDYPERLLRWPAICGTETPREEFSSAAPAWGCPSPPIR